MKQRIISILFFLVLFSGLFLYFNKVFTSSHYFINTSEDFIKLAKQTNIDVLFYGSSKTYTAYNPLLINDKLKTISFNLGTDAQRLPVSTTVLEESLKYTKPKLVVLEIYFASIRNPEEKKAKGFQLRGLDFVSNFSYKKALFVKNNYTVKEYLGVYFPLIRNHNNWQTSQYFDLSRRSDIGQQCIYSDGYIGCSNIISKAIKEKTKEFKKYTDNKNKKLIITTSQKIALAEFVNTAKEKESDVLIVTSPYLSGRKVTNFTTDLRKLCDSLQVKYLDLNDYYDEMKINHNDFKDYSHLNLTGAEKATDFLSKYINNNYKLPNRSADVIWQTKQKELVVFNRRYKELKNEKVKFSKEITGADKHKYFKKISIERIGNTNTVNIEINTDKDCLNTINDYTLGFHVIPKKTDFIYLKDIKKRKFDVFDQKLNIKDSIITFTYQSQVKNIDKINLFLYDKTGFNGYVGKRITLESIVFN